MSKGEKRNRSGLGLVLLALFLLFFSAAFFVYTGYPDSISSRIFLDKETEVDPKEAIIVNFSKPVLAGYLDFKIDGNSKSDFDYRFENYNKKLIINPKKYWQPESGHQIFISGANIFLSSVNKTVYFKTVSYPRISEFYPAYGEKEVVLDIEDPIKASFDKSLDDFKVKFTINPFKDLGYTLDSEKNEINLMPKDGLDKGQKYSISVYMRYKEEDESSSRKISETFFETKPVAPQTWDKDFAVRIEEAKKYTEAKIKEGKYIDINLKSQVLSIFENGNLLDAYMISTGKRGMETSQGNFSVHNKVPRAWSKKYGLFMPYWMAMVGSGDFGIHELPEWPGGYKEGQAHLGTPVSHGCIRLGVGPAERVYSWADLGTPVVIHS
ncbi:MAG: L,D-transpeptidase [Patescibacteria group bacterium]